jgi:3'(2'), 5'-bisphosphate nucleotidase
MRDAAMATTLRRLAVEAGRAIMTVRAGVDLGAVAKPDDSPVTAADLAADRIIRTGLAAAYPAIPVVTEETPDSHAAGLGDATHFLVDPLDGTREFIRADAQFTVNIALVEGGVPTAGVVYAPALARLFRTAAQGGAVEETGVFDPASEGAVRPIAAINADNSALRVVASKSHRDAATDAWIARYEPACFVPAGSSLKFCLIAAGEADLYPRLGPTMEWDTAAGHAVLAAAGGVVLKLPGGAPLTYGHAARRNPWFVAHGPGVVLATD